MSPGRIHVVPEPVKIESTGRQFAFNGFKNFQRFLAKEYDIPRGNWRIVKTKKDGTGIEIRDGEIALWGEEQICYATVIQLIKQGMGKLPEAKITESSSFAFRGYHLDIARDAVPTVETFKRLLRWLFLLKYNHFAIYLEDLFPWKKHPRIGLHRGRLTDKELREIIDYGERLGIEVFPSLNLCGHMEHILTIDEYWAYNEWHRFPEGCLDVSNQKAREFAYELLEEVVDFFPSKHIHIGGDESWSLGRGKSLDKAWSYNGPELYELHHRNMIDMVRKAGKDPIMWGDLILGSILMGDMVSKEAAAKWGALLESDVWKNVTVANWDYSPDPNHDFKARIRSFKERGIDQLACPALRNSDKYLPPFDRALANLKYYLAAARDEKLSAFLVTAWDGECLFSFLDPLILAAAEFGEGHESWHEKWLALSGESDEVFKARALLCSNYDTTATVKQALFKGYSGNRLVGDGRKNLRAMWQNILTETQSFALPEDLDFARKLLEAGVKSLDNQIKPSDYISLSNIYTKLWLAERKPEGLEKFVAKFWSTAGKADANLLRDNTGFMPLPLRY